MYQAFTKKREGNKSSWPLGPEYLTSFLFLMSFFSCPPVLTFIGANLSYLGSSCPHPTSRPCGLLPQRDKETGKITKQRMSSAAPSMSVGLERVRGEAESAVTMEGLSFCRSVTLLCFLNNRAPQHKPTIHLVHAFYQRLPSVPRLGERLGP